ncbi:1-aminocyclopropane-1-carboxylate deaminase/D-cysteine desulfhydrase [Ferruginibacter sp. SUN106]|uniref:1-aminocyclopropane-1-carboxylate deaminase/D-cysteine desulfhydrase n=1 Tax=Ferruginibacter sp. SUN106 TaxID=2978348 RepID=UPI003D368D67
MPFNILNAPIELLTDDMLLQKNISLSVLRLDKIHPVVSGNKLFKLHYFLAEALQSPHKTILSFGGAYSNHLAATAFACQANGLKSIGIVRGEMPAVLSSTLQQCMDYGMQLKFISRAAYLKKESTHFITELQNEFGEAIVIPEGGYHTAGAKGAALIGKLIPANMYTHICTAAGTATTTAGLLQCAGEQQEIISVPVLKGMTDIAERIYSLNGKEASQKHLKIFNEYHFGGYAKKTPGLTGFMNQLWLQQQLPTDFVYTAKLFFAIYDKLKQGYFYPGSNILCLHTGGLQGNNSLLPGTLLF